MKPTPRRIAGQVYLPHDQVAALFEVDAVWLYEVVRVGLLKTCLEQGDRVSIAIVELDRVATIVRLHWRLGLELSDIAAELED